jgi:hypothetical protein
MTRNKFWLTYLNFAYRDHDIRNDKEKSGIGRRSEDKYLGNQPAGKAIGSKLSRINGQLKKYHLACRHDT